MDDTRYYAVSKGKKILVFWNTGDLVEASHYAREKLIEPLVLIQIHPDQGVYHSKQDQMSDLIETPKIKGMWPIKW